jgi:glyoxylase-like metal-dependent hydrolase (beta-lactamase superfamily II)
MSKVLSWGAIAALLAALYWWLWLDHRLPEQGGFEIDVAELRRLADQIPGNKPDELRYEQVSVIGFTESMIVTGGRWTMVDMPVYAYQLRYPDQTLVIDTAMDRSLAQPSFILQSHDDAAFDRVMRGLDQAAQIVITHEHFDHSGGLAKHPRLAEIWPAVRLSETQIAHIDRAAPASLPEALLREAQALRYERHHALAPGVVLIKSPGHTPGSQMVYVQLADGREVLLLGDVAWKQKNLDLPRERPRFVTALLIREDREAVYAQLRALHRLAGDEPGIRQVPGHDAGVVDALTADGVLQAGFVLPE